MRLIEAHKWPRLRSSDLVEIAGLLGIGDYRNRSRHRLENAALLSIGGCKLRARRIKVVANAKTKCWGWLSNADRCRLDSGRSAPGQRGSQLIVDLRSV